jgi:hypothetical protein
MHIDMKTRIKILLLASTLLATAAHASVVLASWENDGLGTVTSVAADSTDAVTSSAVLSLGPDLTATNYDDAFGARDGAGWNGYETTLSGAVSTGAFFQVSLSFTQAVDIDSIFFRLSAQDADDTMQAHFTLRSSLTGATDLDTYVIAPVGGINFSGIEFTTDLSANVALGGVTSVDFYLYVYNPDGNRSGYGQTGIGHNNQTNGTNDLVIQGTVAVPEPGTYALLAGFGALGLVLLRRRLR